MKAAKSQWVLIGCMLLSKHTEAAVCNADNCLRALRGSTSSASAFCKTYTTAVVTATTSLPPFLAGCQSLSSRISSACACFATTTTSASTTTTITTTTTTTTTPTPITSCPTASTTTITSCAKSTLATCPSPGTVTPSTCPPALTITLTETETETISTVCPTSPPVSSTTTPAPNCEATGAPPNSIKNPGFETGGLTNWIFGPDPRFNGRPVTDGTVSSRNVYAGLYSLNLEPGEDSISHNFNLNQTVFACPGTSYELSAYIYIATVNFEICIIQVSHDGVLTDAFFVTERRWVQRTTPIPGPVSGKNTVEISLRANGCSGSLYLDNFAFLLVA